MATQLARCSATSLPNPTNVETRIRLERLGVKWGESLGGTVMHRVTLPKDFFVVVTHISRHIEAGVVVDGGNTVVTNYMWVSDGMDNTCDFGGGHIGDKVQKERVVKLADRDAYIPRPVVVSPDEATAVTEAQSYFDLMSHGASQERLDEAYAELSDDGRDKFHTVFTDPLEKHEPEPSHLATRVMFHPKKTSIWDNAGK